MNPHTHSLIFDKREHGRFTHKNFQEVPIIFGFGVGRTFGVGHDDDLPDEFVENLWREAIRRAKREVVMVGG